MALESRSVGRALALAALVVLAGCAIPGTEDASSTSGPDHPTDAPETDRLGWEGGYWYDDPVAVTAEDGYNRTERAALVDRAMARVERVRGLEFNQSVPVDVISREEYRRNRSGGSGNATYEDWNDQVWEALFLVPEDRRVSDSFDETLGTSVQGYYSPSEEAIVLVSDSATPTVDRRTLAHELTHALQDQQFGLDARPDTQDRQLAADSVVEGEANLVEARYDDNCGAEWSCVPLPDGGSGAGGSVDSGVLLTILTPYTAGQRFVERVRAADGWAGVSDLHDAVPESTEQVIHPGDYPGEGVVNVTVPDRSNGEWRRFDRDPVADVVGEASVFAMFVDNDVVSVDERYSYRSDPSAGWGGDAVVPYTNGSTGAYVWQSAWDTERDAREFVDAYRDLLAAHDATSPRENVFVVPADDPYDDAFRVARNGTTVRIVNAPTADALDAVHDSREGSAGPANGSGTATSSEGGPGFGVGAAIGGAGLASALVAVLVALRRRDR